MKTNFAYSFALVIEKSGDQVELLLTLGQANAVFSPSLVRKIKSRSRLALIEALDTHSNATCESAHKVVNSSLQITAHSKEK